MKVFDTKPAVFDTSLPDQISIEVIDYLRRVYHTLTITGVCCGIGCAIQAYSAAGYYLTILGIIASFALIFRLKMQLPTSENTTQRLLIVYGIGVSLGLTIGPLVTVAFNIDSSIVPTALMASIAVFGSFSLSAFFATRRSYLYLGGFLFSCLSILTIISIVNIFVQSLTLYLVHLYCGLVLFCLYIMYDTQKIIERASNGHFDIAGDVLNLFLDFLNLFIKIVQLYIRSKSRSNNSNSSSKTPFLTSGRKHNDLFDL